MRSPIPPAHPASGADPARRSFDSTATALSRPGGRRRRRTRVLAAIPVLACSSLCVGVLSMIASACLITSTPDFTQPLPRPVLVAANAEPSLRNVLVLDGHNGPESVILAADVFLDSPSTRPIKARLYFDYGHTSKVSGQQQPFVDAIFRFLPTLDPTSVTDGGALRVQAPWYWKQSLSYGCHSITLIVSHEFDDSLQCPTCRDDSTQLTWQVYECDSGDGKPLHACTTQDFSACQGWNDTCPEAVLGGDAGATTQSVCASVRSSP